MRPAKAGALLTLALVAAAAGCSASAGTDKAGGPAAGPVVLRMASTPYSPSDAPPVADFIRRVGVLSGGSVQIQVINQWGDYAPGSEAQVVRAVGTGQVDLGWAGSRVFDTIGVPGFGALSAPMLIDSYPLENAVLKSTLPARMLAGLSKVHVTGLAVLGDVLRHPIAGTSVRLVAGQNGPYIRQACALGARFATATPADLAALRQSLAVVYQSLETDPQASAYLRQIQQLKKSTPPGPAPVIPAGCATRQ